MGVELSEEGDLVPIWRENAARWREFREGRDFWGGGSNR